MDIKLRNIKHSFIYKAIAVFLIWLSFAGIFSAVVFAGKFNDKLDDKNYYENHSYISLFNSCVVCAIDSNILPKLVYNSNDKTGLAYQLSMNQMSNKVNFVYVARNTDTGAVISNFNMGDTWDKSIEIIKKRFMGYNTYLFYSPTEYNLSSNLSDISAVAEKLKYAPVEFYAAVMKPLPGDGFYDIYQERDKVHRLIPVFIAIASVSLLLGIACFIYLIMRTVRRGEKGEVVPAVIDRLYNDLHTLLVLIAANISVQMARSIFDYGEIAGIISIFILLSIDLMLGLSYLLSMTRHIIRRTLFSHTLIFTLARLLAGVFRQCFSSETFKPGILALLLLYGAVNAIVFAIATHIEGGFRLLFFFLVVFNFAVAYFTLKALSTLSTLMVWVKEMAGGNLDKNVYPAQLSPVFAAFANDIANLQTGIRYTVAEAVKGERLKTELITNVSHDLKTPLTSIINYVDLLKKENYESETFKEYIGVLEEKSGRLKKLIEDLMEASKAASGDMPVNTVNVDLCSLAGQAVAEYNEKFLSAGLDIRMKTCEKPVVVKGDGALLWRIMDNLLSNVVKYAQKNSRVYIDLEQSEAEGRITVKNISEVPLDISADQLLERFVRGDSSRATEGSGLGLSIARSLSEIQGGKLELSIDGDLFKVIVSLPLAA